MWVIPYIITYKFSKITVSPRIMVLTNFDTPLWPRRTSRDQDLNKFESTLPLEASSQVPFFFLTKWFLKDLDTMFNRERFLKNYSVIKLYSYKKNHTLPRLWPHPTLWDHVCSWINITRGCFNTHKL